MHPALLKDHDQFVGTVSRGALIWPRKWVAYQTISQCLRNAGSGIRGSVSRYTRCIPEFFRSINGAVVWSLSREQKRLQRTATVRGGVKESSVDSTHSGIYGSMVDSRAPKARVVGNRVHLNIENQKAIRHPRAADAAQRSP